MWVIEPIHQLGCLYIYRSLLHKVFPRKPLSRQGNKECWDAAANLSEALRTILQMSCVVVWQVPTQHICSYWYRQFLWHLSHSHTIARTWHMHHPAVALSLHLCALTVQSASADAVGVVSWDHRLRWSPTVSPRLRQVCKLKKQQTFREKVCVSLLLCLPECTLWMWNSKHM